MSNKFFTITFNQQQHQSLIEVLKIVKEQQPKYFEEDRLEDWIEMLKDIDENYEEDSQHLFCY